MAEALNHSITLAGIDIGKNSFHVIGLDGRGAIVLRQKWLRGQVEGIGPAFGTTGVGNRVDGEGGHKSRRSCAR